MIVVNLKGGLGNQMFQYAFGLALAHKHGTVLKFDIRFLRDQRPRKNVILRNYDLNIFSIPALQATAEDLTGVGLGWKSLTLQRLWLRLYSFTPSQSRVLLEKQFSFDQRNLEAGKDCYVDGYWQSEKYFKSVEMLVRERFVVRTPLVPAAEGLLRNIASDESVCVNVRREDLVNDPRLGAIALAYFERAVEELKERIGSGFKIYIFSDDLQWCRENFRFGTKQEFVDHEFAGEKFSTYLVLMSSCKHFIVPNSTFAWWAAWLSRNENKIVIGPERWFLDTRVDARDVLPETWLKV